MAEQSRRSQEEQPPAPQPKRCVATVGRLKDRPDLLSVRRAMCKPSLDDETPATTATASRLANSPSQPESGVNAATSPAAPRRKDQVASTQPDLEPASTDSHASIIARERAAASRRKKAAGAMAQIPKIGCSIRPIIPLKRIFPSMAARQTHSSSWSTIGWCSTSSSISARSPG